MKRRAALPAILLLLVLLPLAAAPTFATTFTLETVDSGFQLPPDPLFSYFDFPSIAVDPAGDPHVAYSDPNTSTIKHAFRSGGVWSIEVVAPSGPDLIDGVVIAFPSIAIDASGNPHISFYDAPSGTLAYASKSAGTWSIETVDNGYDVGRGTSLVLDSSGNPHVAYYDEGNSDLKYAVKSGGVWQVETVDSDGFVGQQGRLALDASGRPHISYMDYSDGALQYATKSGGAWSFEALYVTAPGTSIPNDIAVDSAGRVHVSYQRASGGDLYYAVRSGGVWTTEAVDVPGSVGADNSIALTSTGQPRISYHEGGTLRNLKYAVKSGGVWTAEVVDAPGSVGRRTELALDTSGTPYIVYADLTNFTVKVASGVAGSGSIAGSVLASCPAVGTPLLGVTIDAFDVGSQMLSGTAVTDGAGTYTLGPLAPGDYNVVIVSPLGYIATPQEQVVTVSGGASSLDFALSCAPAPPPSDGVRPTGFWKHQAGVAVSGKGGGQVDASTMCGYLDLIALHFNSNAVNPVVVYVPPASGECDDKLLVASNLLNLKGSAAARDLARQQLLSLLLNVASGRLGTMTVISADGATTSQAITYCDNLIDSPTGDYARARSIAETINGGGTVASGMIPLTTAQIAYRQGLAPRTFRVTPNPGPADRLFRFSMAEPGAVRLRVFDVAGRLVASLAEGRMEAGHHTVAWNGLTSHGSEVGGGIYLARLETAEGSRTLKVVLLAR